MEAFTTKGHWWLPGNRPDDAIAGILTFDPHGQSELELFGSFLMQTRNEPIILGVGDKGQAITLVGCVDLGTGFSVSNYNWEYAKYRPRIVLQNHHFEREEEISFDKLWVKYYGLEEWASTGKGWGTISADTFFQPRDSEDTVSVDLEGFRLNLFRRHSGYGDQWNSISIHRDAEIEIVPECPWDKEEILAKLFQMQVFLGLAMRTSTWPVSVEVSNPSNHFRNITLHYSPVTDFRKTDRMNAHFMYFILEEKIEKIEKRLGNWFVKCETLDQVLRLFNRAISENMYLEDKFLTYAKAVEVYHRQMYEETIIDKEEFKKIKEDLKKPIKSCICSDNYKELRRRIYESMNLANSPSLHDRLVELQERHQIHNQELFGEFEVFAKDVISTRDQLTHFFDAAETKARLDDHSLYYMSEKLRLILDLCLLSELGFSDEELQQMAVKNIPPDPGRPESTAPQPVQSGG